MSRHVVNSPAPSTITPIVREAVTAYTRTMNRFGRCTFRRRPGLTDLLVDTLATVPRRQPWTGADHVALDNLLAAVTA